MSKCPNVVLPKITNKYYTRIFNGPQRDQFRLMNHLYARKPAVLHTLVRFSLSGYDVSVRLR